MTKSKPAFAQTLKQTRRELERLRDQRDELDSRIKRLEHVEAALRGVTERPEKGPALSGLTDVARYIFKRADQPITPTELRDLMLTMGFSQKAYQQFLASVHVILKRLCKNNEVLEFTFSDKKTYYWASKAMPAGPHPENVLLLKYYGTHRVEDLTTTQSYDEVRAKSLQEGR